MDDEKIPVCVHCWVEVERPPEGKMVIGEAPSGWIHKYLKNPVGNPNCGKHLLEDEEVEFVSSVSEA